MVNLPMRFIKLLAYLPTPVMYGLSGVVRFFVEYIFRYRYAVIKRNLENSFPDKSNEEIAKLIHGFYRNLSDVLAEAIRAIRIPKSEIEQRVKFTNPELAHNYIKNGQSIIVLASHTCNWEWLLLGCNVQFPAQIDAVYKRLRNPVSDAQMLKVRGKFGSHMIEMNSLFKAFVTRKEVTRAIALVADQTPGGSKNDCWCTFLGQETCFYPGPEKLAIKSGYPVLYVGMKRVKRGYYEVYFEEISKPPYGEFPRIIEKYAEALEKNILISPSDWLWSHKRWKHQRPL
ncbi:MAG: lysophospholipid acyltransferase family protein [Cytophagales bacterium]|nr:lysophospholipid acyltransferase family protein [Cytophagales bacterium]